MSVPFVPLLEDLTLVALLPTSHADGWNAPLTPPNLTGILDLKMFGRVRPVARKLLDFLVSTSEIDTLFSSGDAKLVTSLFLISPRLR